MSAALQTLVALRARAIRLGDEVEQELANSRFHPVLRQWVPARADAIRALASEADFPVDRAVGHLELVLNQLHTLIGQRRNPVLRTKLGDADTLAAACYEPIVTFAQAQGLPLSTATPVTQLSDVDLSIWTGFAPTSVAPIFLPPSFFEDLTFWPALCHEIGHDFLVSVQGLGDALRHELGLPPEELGTVPIELTESGIEFSEVVRLFGGWFDEVFSDVFGTMMCGPAYLASMMHHFERPEDPQRAMTVFVDATRQRYDVHPPAHLRVAMGYAVLARAGFLNEARPMMEAWRDAHVHDDSFMLVPIAGRWLRLPYQPFEDVAVRIAERLYAGPLQSLRGHGLQDISGLDYGPHQHAESLRSKDALLRGQVPTARDPRAVIAGAVLAHQERPELEAALLANARAAIPAMGTRERRPDRLINETRPQGEMRLTPREFREAFLLNEILERPRAHLGRRRPI